MTQQYYFKTHFLEELLNTYWGSIVSIALVFLCENKPFWKGVMEKLWFVYILRFCVFVYVQLCLTLCRPMDCSPPSSSVHGSLQAKILEWVAISSCRGSSWPRDWTCVSYIAGGFLTTEPHGKPWLCPQIMFLSQASFTQISNRKISMVVAWGVFLHLSTRGVSKKQMKFWDRKLSENQVNFLFFFLARRGQN